MKNDIIIQSIACGFECYWPQLRCRHLKSTRGSENKEFQWCQRVIDFWKTRNSCESILKAERKFPRFSNAFFRFLHTTGSILLYFDCWLHFSTTRKLFFFVCHWKSLMAFWGSKTPEIQMRRDMWRWRSRISYTSCLENRRWFKM